MVAYNQRILETSASEQRRQRAGRMLMHLRPLLAQLETNRTEEVIAPSEQPPRDVNPLIVHGVEYEAIQSVGRQSLTAPWDGGSSLSGGTFEVTR